MKFYIPFGDWSNDGHCGTEFLFVEAPSMLKLKEAQDNIREIYGQHFFDDFAEEYDSPTLSEANWQALIDTDYPVERLIKTERYNDWTGMQSLVQVLAEDDNPHVSIGFVEDAFVWLLNAFGANIRVCEKEELIPVISNWTCQGFQTVGYGCF